jgi:rhodanese-related sulfurtransferase
MAAWAILLMLAVGMQGRLAGGAAITDVTVEQARHLIQERSGKADFVVLDVRTPGEFAGGRLPGAVNLDVQASDFEPRLGALDRGKTYLVYCRTGNRSAKAIQVMQRLGFRLVYHMSEGIVGWEKKGFPVSRAS